MIKEVSAMKDMLGCLCKGALLLLLVVNIAIFAPMMQRKRFDEKDKEVVFFQKMVKIGMPAVILACRQVIDQRNELDKNNIFPDKINLPPVIKELNPDRILVYENQVQLRTFQRNYLCCFSEGIDGYGSMMLTNGLWHIDDRLWDKFDKPKHLLPNKKGWTIDGQGNVK